MGLTQLEWLDLSGTEVSDAGLKRLEKLTQLQGFTSPAPRSARGP